MALEPLRWLALSLLMYGLPVSQYSGLNNPHAPSRADIFPPLSESHPRRQCNVFVIRASNSARSGRPRWCLRLLNLLK